MTFRAAPREITLLVGANGAGKSTTIKVLAGLIRPQGGSAHINRIDIVDQRIAAQRSLAYLPQRPSFHPRMTCAEILRFYARLRAVAASRYEAVLDLAGLREFERVRTSALSGGTRQRLGLALLLLPDAPVLLLDEPGLSLDPGWRQRLQDTLRFEAERGKTVLVTTHLVREWNNVAHRCLLCRDGKIERELDPTNLPHNFDEMEQVAPDAHKRSTINEPHFSIVG
jgi:ABC-type multidrug transport system ATPase subunit